MIVEQDDVTRDEGADNEERNGEDEVEDVVEERERRILAEGGKGEKEVTAKVVGIVKRNWRTYWLPLPSISITAFSDFSPLFSFRVVGLTG